MSAVMQSQVAQTLKKTLEAIETDKPTKEVAFTKWCKVQKIDDAYVDWLEWAPPGLASEKSEGGDVPMGTMRPGALYRAWARTFGLGLTITQEAIEDTKDKEVVAAAKYLTTAIWKTADLDATNMLARAFNTSYVGGDDVPLCSASHPLANGGTFSNIMATPMAPSRGAVITMTTNLMNMPGHDGLPHGYEPDLILCPNAQWAAWTEIIKSSFAPEPGEFNRINVVNSELNLKVLPLKWLQSTDTNWFATTSCDSKLRFCWKRRPEGDAWVENSNQVMIYTNTARWTRLWTNPRCLYGANA